MTENKLRMTFDPATIEHLGIQMYSTLPPVMAELIANAHDADAPVVEICLKDDGPTKEIIVSDKGTGMSFKEINDKFLRIGRNRRSAEGWKGKSIFDELGENKAHQSQRVSSRYNKKRRGLPI
jgi:signal transduction histidine kinase